MTELNFIVISEVAALGRVLGHYRGLLESMNCLKDGNYGLDSITISRTEALYHKLLDKVQSDAGK